MIFLGTMMKLLFSSGVSHYQSVSPSWGQPTLKAHIDTLIADSEKTIPACANQQMVFLHSQQEELALHVKDMLATMKMGDASEYAISRCVSVW